MKEVSFSYHALQQMRLRGASIKEVVFAIRNRPWQPGRPGYKTCKARFDHNAVSPVNGKHYKFKTVEVVLADDLLEIVVITVKVYYSNLEAVR